MATGATTGPWGDPAGTPTSALAATATKAASIAQDGPDSSPPTDGPLDPADALTAILASLPPAERAAVVAHVRALARMTPKRRAALLSITDTE